MHIARIAALIFAFINILGLVWFIDNLEPYTIIFGVTAVISALIVSITPRRFILPKNEIIVVMISLCIVGSIATFMLIVQDYQRSYGPDMGPIIIRLMFIFVFASIGFEILKGREDRKH